jgi:hypothetical protein
MGAPFHSNIAETRALEGPHDTPVGLEAFLPAEEGELPLQEVEEQTICHHICEEKPASSIGLPSLVQDLVERMEGHP